MNFNEYSSKVAKTAHYSNGLMYTVLALGGEAGELQNEYKKHLRDHTLEVIPNEDRRTRMLLELGDILWYTTRTAHELGSSLQEVAVMNVAKLEVRYAK